MELKIGGEISSRFSIAWWFCRFLARPRRWCSLSGGRRLKWRHLWREERRSDSSHQGGGFRSGFTCVALQFLHDLLCLQVPDVNHVVLGARHDPLQEAGLASHATKKPLQQQQQCLPSHRWQRNWQICSTSHSYGQCRFSSTVAVKEEWFIKTSRGRNWGILPCAINSVLTFPLL